LVTFLARDPLLFHAMGIFMATFLYSIAALAWVDRNGSGRIPFLSALVVIGLLLASMGMFVGLVHRLAGMHVSNVLRFTGDFGRRTLDKLYPPLSARDVQTATEDFRSLPAVQTLFYTGPPRTIQLLDVAAFLALAEESGGIVEVTSAVGDTVVEGTLLLRIFTARQPINANALLNAIRVGTQRTFEQDPKYAIRLLVDIAIRALSPAVNDPSTAVQALDHIEDLLVRLGRRRLEIGEIRDRAGRLRVVIPIPTWEDFLHLALDEIRFYGVESLQVMRRMRALLSDLKDAVCEVRRNAVRDQEKRLDATIARSFADLEDLLEASVEDREGLGAPRKRNVIRTGTNGDSGQLGLRPISP
jgi:uncharacterized membrane protein